jgi:hypothetical protein
MTAVMVILVTAMGIGPLTASSASASTRVTASAAEPAIALVGPPPAPPGGSVHGPYGSLEECEAWLEVLKSLAPPGDWEYACSKWDDGSWYVFIWPRVSAAFWSDFHSDLYLDVDGVSQNNGARIHQWSYTGAANQLWRRYTIGDSYSILVSVNSGKCMGVTGSSLNSGANVVQWDCNGSSDQEWYFQPTGGYKYGYPVYRVVNRHSGLCLGVLGGNSVVGSPFVQWTCNGNSDQYIY